MKTKFLVAGYLLIVLSVAGLWHTAATMLADEADQPVVRKALGKRSPTVSMIIRLL